MSTSTGDPRPLVGHLSLGDDQAAGPNAGGGGAAKCLGMGVVGVVVTILIILGLIGGGVVFFVLSHRGDGTLTTTATTTTTTTTAATTTSAAFVYDETDPNCVNKDEYPCVECNDGYQLFGTDRCFFKCHSDLVFDIVNGSQKGITVDDTTLHWCASNMPYHWPNANEQVGSLRMFKAWQGGWDAESSWLDRRNRWWEVAKYLHLTGAKVLVGTQVTCNKTEDDADWEDVKAMIQIFGSEHIMGLAVGNELELLFQKDSVRDHYVECMNMIWTDGYFLDVFHNRVHDMDSLGEEYKSIPITSVFGGAIFASWPFMNIPVDQTYVYSADNPAPMTGNVLGFVNNVTIDFGMRWVWTLNVYPYFDQGAFLDPDGGCEAEIQRATCFVPESGDPNDCEFTRLVALMRDRMAIENFNAAGARHGNLWIGETGWSFPKADTLDTVMQWCPKFSSEEVFQKYYKAFLEWDMQMTGESYIGYGPDFVFWFTMRDSSNFGKQEHFGLVGDGDPTAWCSNATCKLQDRGFFTTTTPYTGTPTTTTTLTANTTTTTTPASTSKATRTPTATTATTATTTVDATTTSTVAATTSSIATTATVAATTSSIVPSNDDKILI